MTPLTLLTALLRAVRVVRDRTRAYTAPMLPTATRVALVFAALAGSAVARAQEQPLPAPLPAPEPSPPAPEPAPSAEPAPAPTALAPAPEAAAKPGAPAVDPDAFWTPPLFGDPVAYSRRPPTNRFLTVEADLRYALVGSGPTRFVSDFRLSILDWWEVGTQLGPVIIPERLTTRISVGPWRRFGRFGVEFGFHKLDLGARLFPEEGEDRGFNPDIVPSVNAVGALTYDVPVWDRFALHFSARVQQRLQHSFRGLLDMNFKDPLNQFSWQLAASGSWDITKTLSMTTGLAYGTAMDNQMFKDIFQRARDGGKPQDDPDLPRLDYQRAVDRKDPLSIIDTRGRCGEARTRTLFIDFVETARPGYSTLVDRDNNCSASVSGALTYGRTEAFDVDLFGATRVWPNFGWLFGAGVRWRIAP